MKIGRQQVVFIEKYAFRISSAALSLAAGFLGILGASAVLASGAVAADSLALRVGAVTYAIDPATLTIDAVENGTTIDLMPPLHAPEAAAPAKDGTGWRWTDAEGRVVTAGTEEGALHLTITAAPGSSLAWDLPNASTGTWLVPDGEGMAFKVADPFWQTGYRHEHCFNGSAGLSFPAWSHMDDQRAVTYALGDGFKSQLCLREADGMQARLTHDFTDGATTLDLLFAVGPAQPLAPALFYRSLLKSRGQFTSFADKAVPDLPRLFGAPQAYVWGDGRDPAFLDDLEALGIKRIVLSYDQGPETPAWLRKANAQGYLAGPYEDFNNAQPAASSDSATSIWSNDLYPAGCIHDAKGQAAVGFANRGCSLSSEALARHPGAPSPASRYAAHAADGATEVFVDSDAFGEFSDDYSPDHPMTMAGDRVNRLNRLGLAITRYHLVVGSENITAWATGVTHFSHGTAQAHVGVVWKLLNDNTRFGGWWPAGRPALFFKPFQPTADEARQLFGPADQLPLFEAAFHDSVVAADRWEFGLMKVAGLERTRFARSLLYGTPTMWNLDRKELARVGPWLKAAEDDFRTAHSWDTPVALTGFRWLSDDRLVQQTTYADGRVLIANFSEAPWQGLGPDCVRLILGQHSTDMCPPADPPPFK